MDEDSCARVTVLANAGSHLLLHDDLLLGTDVTIAAGEAVSSLLPVDGITGSDPSGREPDPSPGEWKPPRLPLKPEVTITLDQWTPGSQLAAQANSALESGATVSVHVPVADQRIDLSDLKTVVNQTAGTSGHLVIVSALDG